MQTFLPYEDFQRSAACLDDKRLGKQRVECMQILATLTEESDGWENHPAVLMWEGHEGALILYTYEICKEWVARGFKDAIKSSVEEYEPIIRDTAWFDPPWMGDEKFHLSHQSNLVRKEPEHYRMYFPDVPDDMDYVWPVSLSDIS